MYGIPTNNKLNPQEVSTSESENPQPSVDPVKRSYVPIREKYIKIVKHCRKIFCEGCEKRGRKDFKQTCIALIQLKREIQYQRNMEAIKRVKSLERSQ